MSVVQRAASKGPQSSTVCSLPPHSMLSNKRIDHLKALMVQKVARRYKEATGLKVTASKLAIIHEELDRIIATRTPTDSDLLKLVAKLKLVASNASNCKSIVSRASESLIDSTPAANNTADGSAISAASMTNDYAAKQMSDIPFQPPSNSPGYQARKRLGNVDMWAKLSKKDLQDYEKEEDRRRKRHKDRMVAQRRALDDQIAQLGKKKQEEKKEEEAELKNEEQKLQEWQQEVQKDGRRKREAYEKEKRDRDDQLKDIERRKAQDEEMKRLEENRIADKIRVEMEAEQATTMKKKQKMKDNVAKFMEYNAEQRAMKEREKQKECDLDRQLHMEYINKLEKQEKERERSLKKLYDRQHRQIQAGSKMAAGLAERALEDERRAVTEQKKMFEKASKAEELKNSQIAREKENIKSYLAQQIHDKEARKLQERQELAGLKESLMADVRAAESQEREQRMLKRVKNVENRAAIEKQILGKHRPETQEAMTSNERRINKQLLRRLSDFDDV